MQIQLINIAGEKNKVFFAPKFGVLAFYFYILVRLGLAGGETGC